VTLIKDIRWDAWVGNINVKHIARVHSDVGVKDAAANAPPSNFFFWGAKLIKSG